MRKLVCSAIAGAMCLVGGRAIGADYYTYANIHVFTYSPGDGTGWPAWLAFSQINTNFGWISNALYNASNVLHQARLNSTNDLAAALTANLNGASNVLRQARIDSTNDLAAVLTADLNSASNVLYGLIGEGGGVSWTTSSNLSYEVSKLATNTLMGTVQGLVNAKMYSPGTQPPAYFWASPADAYGTLVPRLIVGTDLPGYGSNWVNQAPGYLPQYAVKPLTDFQPVLATGTDHQVLAWHPGSPGAYYPHTTLLTLDGLTGDATLNGHVATNLQSVNWSSGSHDAFSVWDYAAASGSRAFVVYSGADPGEILIANYLGIKFPEVTASRALYLDANNYVVGSSTTSDELGYVHGVTSAIQTQLDNRIKGIFASTGLSGTTNNGVVTLSATTSGSTLLQSGTVNMATDGTVTTIYTITGIPDNCSFSVYGLVSAYGSSGGTAYSACADAVAHGVKTGGVITVNYGTALSGMSNSFTTGGYDDDGSGNLKISVSWNRGIGTAHAKWTGFVNIVQ